jgi:hypothetical protein
MNGNLIKQAISVIPSERSKAIIDFIAPGDDRDVCRVVRMAPLGKRPENRFCLARSQRDLEVTQKAADR